MVSIISFFLHIILAHNKSSILLKFVSDFSLKIIIHTSLSNISTIQFSFFMICIFFFSYIHFWVTASCHQFLHHNRISFYNWFRFEKVSPKVQFEPKNKQRNIIISVNYHIIFQLNFYMSLAFKTSPKTTLSIFQDLCKFLKYQICKNCRPQGNKKQTGQQNFSNFSCMFLNPNDFFQFEFELF